MNCKLLLDLLMSRLGNRTEPALRATCLLEMTLTQHDILENRPNLPWFLEVHDTVVTTTINQRTVAQPAAMIRALDDGEKPLVYVPADVSQPEVILENRALDELLVLYQKAISRAGFTDPANGSSPSEVSGSPQKYATRYGEYMIFPLSDKVYNIKHYAYYSRLSDPVDNAGYENAWMIWCPELLLAHTGAKIATLHLQDPDLAGIFSGQIMMFEKRLDDLITAREEADRDRNMG